MPNDPYSNFIPMQAYMNANPQGNKETSDAMSREMNEGSTGKYDQKGSGGAVKSIDFDQFIQSQKDKGAETEGMSEIDKSLWGTQGLTGPSSGKVAPGKAQNPTNNEPGTPGNDPNSPMPGARKPPGKQQNPAGNDDQSVGPGFSNASPFNPMIAQLQQAMMMGQPQPQPKGKDTQQGDV